MENKSMNGAYYKPNRGDIVRCKHDFSLERMKYHYNYPRIGDILTVNGVATEFSTKKYLLSFVELKIPVPLYAYHFDLIQSIWEGDDILQEIDNLLQK